MSERCLECPKRKKLEYSGFWCCDGNQCEVDVRKDEREKAFNELRESIMNCPFDYSVKIALDVLIDRKLKEQK